jgi:hypothetical protein
VARTGARRGACRVLVGRRKKNKLAEKSRRSWEDNIKMYVKRSVRVTDWIDVAQNREKWQAHVKAVINLWVP